MTFNSTAFFVFFALFLAGYLAVRNRDRLRLSLIVAGSAVFYGWWDWRFLFLIAGTGSVDFVAARLMRKFPARSICRKLLLSVSLTSGLGVLSVFKYSEFFARAIEGVLRAAGISCDLVGDIPDFCLILPVGISFYTFQSLSYTIDVYRGELEPTRDPIHFFAYLMLFPQLVAGPIVRAADLLWQIAEPPALSGERAWNGLRLCVFGFFKKCVVADGIAHYVDTAFANVMMEKSSSFWWISMIAFAVQIYFDFAGYTDIARGVIEMLGYRFGINFNHPYLATGVKDFWRRWHISLSSWFRDYLFFPLGGSRGSTAKTVRNLWIVFLLSGLWHGAGWNFVVWGGVHALWLSLERLFGYQDRIKSRIRGGVMICWLVTQVQILVAWVFFRAETMTEALFILKRMFSFRDFLQAPPQVVLYLLLFLAVEYWEALRIGEGCRRRYRWAAVCEPVALALMAAAAFWFRGEGRAFVYFQF